MIDFNIEPPVPDLAKITEFCTLFAYQQRDIDEGEFWRVIIDRAIAWATPIVAQQAADAELEACKKFVLLNFGCDATNRLHAARRSDSLLPSLKEQALALLEPREDEPLPDLRLLNPEQQDIIRRALESIPDETP